MNEYPKWVDEYTAAVHHAFTGMAPSQWGSLNLFEVLPYLNGAFIDKLYEAVQRLKEKNVPISEIVKSFSTPSSIRNAMYDLAEEYRSTEPKPKQKFKEIAELLAAVLGYWTPEDPFGLHTNRAHRPEEVETMLKDIPWVHGTPLIARELGRVYNSSAAISFALYRDMFPQESQEIYGPYDASTRFGEGAILVIKDFPKIKPVDLWPGAADFKHERVTIYQVYRGVDCKIDWIGMHSLYQGDLINGLAAYAVKADGKFLTDLAQIKAVRMELEQTALAQSKAYDAMTHKDWIKKVLEWDCYQFNKFFELAGMDWHPTKEMLERTKDAKASMGFGIESFPPLEEYASSPKYEPYWLKDLYN